MIGQASKAKEAITAAKRHVAELFEGESITPPSLEEVEHDDVHGLWKITISYTRSIMQKTISAAFHPSGSLRDYKIITLNDNDLQLVSMKNRV